MRKESHDKYLECLESGKSTRAAMTRIHSDNHQIKVSTTNKIALSCFDDKRYIELNGINTLPHGHYSLQQVPPVDENVVSEHELVSSDSESSESDMQDEGEPPVFEILPNNQISPATSAADTFGYFYFFVCFQVSILTQFFLFQHLLIQVSCTEKLTTMSQLLIGVT